MGVYYGNRVPTRMQGILTRPFVGLNEYSPPTSLNENYMSDLLDVRPYRNEGLEFIVDSAIVQLMATEGLDAGAIRSVLVSSETTATTYVFYIMCSATTFWKIHKVYYTALSQTITSYTMTVDSLPALQVGYFCSSAIFTTEADTYYCFISSHTKNLHFIHVTSAGVENYAYTTLPFYPKKMVVHANRLFIIDTKNKLWWCRAGDVYSWYSMEYDDNALMASTTMANGAYSLTAQPDVPRVATVTVTKQGTLDTLGTVALVGVSPTDAAQTEDVVPKEGRVQSLKSWKSITSATQSGHTAAGTADKIEIGWGPVGSGYVQEDAGYWTIEREPIINDMCVIAGNIYLFSPNNIYVFQGYSYETFSLQLYIADIGIDILAAPAGYNCLSVVRNTAYFMYNWEIYEFNGQSTPKVISRPVMVNNAMTNSIMGGISLTGTEWVLSSTIYGLYVYQKLVNPGIYYYFDFETRTWWKHSGIINTDVSSVSNVFVRYIPNYTMDSMFAFVVMANAPADFVFSLNLGRIHTYQPYIVTKAFNTNPSDLSTLTEVLLMLQGTSGSTADIELLYSLTESGNDFVSIKSWENYIFNGDTEILAIPMPVSAIANAHHYRLKLIIGDSYTNPVRLYNIERRFRVQGRAR